MSILIAFVIGTFSGAVYMALRIFDYLRRQGMIKDGHGKPEDAFERVSKPEGLTEKEFKRMIGGDA